MAKSDGAAPIRITTASSNRNLDIASRQRKYIISMAIRSACFIGAVIAGLAGVNWLWPILIGGAIVLPYIAVVLANAADMRGDNFSLMDSPYGRPQLPPGDEESR